MRNLIITIIMLIVAGLLLGLAPAPARAMPPVPTGLVATPVSSTQINLTWNAAYGAVRYQVYVNDAMVAEQTYYTNFSHTGLTPGTTYNYRVGASDGVSTSQASAWSAAVAAATFPVRWYIFSILVPTDTAPNLFTQYTAVPIPVPYVSRTDCDNAVNWFVGQLVGGPPPGPNAVQRMECFPL